MNSLEWRVARRYMKGGRKGRLASLITFIAAGGVVIGVLALVVVMGVMNGLQTELRNRILIGSPHLQIFTYGSGLRVDDWRNALDVIRSHEDVVAAAPVVISMGIVNAGANFDEAIYVIGLDPDTGSAAVTEIAEYFVRGDLAFETSRDDVVGSIVLGQHVHDRLGVFPGERLSIISPGSRYNRATGSYVPRILPFEVGGSFNTGMYEYDQRYALLRLDVAQDFAGLDSAVSGLYVRVNDPWRAADVGSELVTMLGPTVYRYVDWQTQNFSLFSALRLEKLGMALILTLIIMVAAFNIISTLTMVVADKTREIGILRAMGFPAHGIRRVFVMQGAFIGVVGTAIGAGIGLATAYVVDRFELIRIPAHVYFVDHLPVLVDPLDVLLIVGISMTVATVATIYPAAQAARFTPVEAIRHQ